jgi:hypothetical protein
MSFFKFNGVRVEAWGTAGGDECRVALHVGEIVEVFDLLMADGTRYPCINGTWVVTDGTSIDTILKEVSKYDEPEYD